MNIRLYDEYTKMLNKINKKLEKDNLHYEEKFSLQCQREIIEACLAQLVDSWMFDE
jgi:hypothetical protein